MPTERGKSHTKRAQSQSYKKHPGKDKHHGRFFWINSGKELVNRVRAFDYPADKEGMCFGLASVAAHAMLTHTLTEFNQNLLELQRLPNIVEPRKKIQQKNAQTQPSLEKRKPYQDKKNIQLRAMCEAISLAQMPGKFKAIFPSVDPHRNYEPVQRVENLLPLFQSTNLEAKGGAVVIDKFSGVYSASELCAVFQIIRTASQKYPHTFSLLLSDDCHIVSATFNNLSKKWNFVEFRRLPVREYDHDHDIAKAVKTSLSPSLSKTVLSAVFLVSNEEKKEAKKAMQWMLRQPNWQALQAITKVKKPYLYRWLFIAAFEGCEREVGLLLKKKHGLNPDKPKLNKDNPLTVAAAQGHSAVVRLLLKAGADPDASSIKDGSSPLYLACLGGHTEAEQLIREYGGKMRIDETLRSSAVAGPTC